MEFCLKLGNRYPPQLSCGPLHRLIAGRVSLQACRLALHVSEMQAPALMGDHHEPGLIGPATWFRIEAFSPLFIVFILLDDYS